MNRRNFNFRLATTLALGASMTGCAQSAKPSPLDRIVDETIRPVMQENDVAGMAVAVTARGQRHFFNFGLASKQSGQAVTESTIFEVGSLSKTFTATLGAYAQATGALALTDKASRYLPALAGSSFDGISLLELCTYTAGGLPLQFPDEVASASQMVDYFRSWRPVYAPGTHRLYSNPSIGLFGHLAARSLGAPFDELMQARLLPLLGLSDTFLQVPARRMGDYAQGYARDGRPVRVSPGMLDSEAYGVKTTSADMIRFVEAQMDATSLDPALRRAVAATHTGYFDVDGMTQGLGWETYAAPAELDQLLAGNSSQMALEPKRARTLAPPLPPRAGAWINKTGSTNGFGAYAAFVPAQRVGIVMLANRNYPNTVRVKAAHRILAALGKSSSEAGVG
ncbi:class C beta-lactamase [Variovorax sp. KK3]|uniref:class C beta-lactamase n=1 Tax=Variovorax sp. KK3 TaxID=1855728 RepID=UPI00097C91A1|nr:class C beta-lactamase [Variovorax sp. KK3]